MTTSSSFKIYRIRNRITGAEETLGAESAQDACFKLDWLIGDCQVTVLIDPNEYQEDPITRRFLQGRGSLDN